MKTKTYTVYKFEELPKESQKLAIENYYDINVDYDEWSDCAIEPAKEELNDVGVKNVEISYSGFCSQGSGASFTGDIQGDDVEKFLKHLNIDNDIIRKCLNTDVEISFFRERSDYVHENSVSTNLADYSIESDKEDEKLSDDEYIKLEEDIENWRKGKSKEIYKELEDSYYYLTEEKQVAETLIANDYDFTLGGNID